MACGSRTEAYSDYCTAIKRGEQAFLLVDSENPVTPNCQKGHVDNWKPWLHLKERDGWDKPDGAQETDCHLMVQTMESWFLTDSSALLEYFGNGFNMNPIPKNPICVETLSKEEVLKILNRSIIHCTTKGKSYYDKGMHSFNILAILNPNKVIIFSPWANRFINELKVKMKD